MTTRSRSPLHLALCLLALLPFASTRGHADDAVDGATTTVRLALPTEPATLNSMRATDQYASFILRHVMEGLLQYDAAGHLAPALATRWEIDAHGARFWLREDARWEDGSPVTADDFVHAWREVLRPKTASPYATLLYPLRNARAIAAGELPPESLGVRAPDPYRLDVAFAEPCAWFPALTAHMTLLPLSPAFHAAQGDRYGTDVGRLLANGPYRLVRWVHGAAIALERNPRYREARAVRIARIEVPYITSDPQAELNLFLDRRIALANVSGESVARVLPLRLQLRQFRTGLVEFLGFNFRDGRPTRNLALRRAVQAAVDTDVLLNRVVRLPAARVTDSLFPSVLSGRDKAFTREYPLAPPPRGETAAREWLAQAQRELGVTVMPPLVLLVSDESTAQKTAEYLQARLHDVLGIEVRIDRQILKQRLQKMNQGEYDIALANWSPDFDDPITFAELFASWSPFNRGHYASEPYDREVRIAQTETDPVLRLAAMDRVQRLVVSDAPIVPLYESARIYLQHPRLHGVVRAPFGGDPDLRWAWVE